jgi:hypothetical protein
LYYVLTTVGALSLVLSACRKDIALTAPAVVKEERAGLLEGVIADDPSVVAAVPLIISRELLSGLPPSSRLSAAMLGKARRDATAPSVSFMAPSNGASLSGAVTIQVSATDNVGISKVQVYVDGILKSTISTLPYNLSWNTATVANGAHTLRAVAYDAAGNSAASQIGVNVSNLQQGDISSPSVSITAPANGSAVTGSVVISASASDNVGVNSVEFRIDGALLSVDNTAPYSASWNTSGYAAGSHTIVAVAKDAAGNTAQHSVSVTINTTVVDPGNLPSSLALVMPAVQNQGGESSCVPFAVAYAARSVEAFYRNNSSGYALGSNVFSPEYMYNQIKSGDCGSGSAVTTALQFLIDNGVCTWQTMPYSSTNGCSLFPSTSQIAEAGQFRIASYARVLSSDVTAIKSMLVAKHAVIITVGTDDSFWNAQPGFVWKAYSGPIGISHSLVVCGYDDARHAYKVMNSWGTGWGDAGYSWIDYDFLPQCAFYYSYVIQ